MTIPLSWVILAGAFVCGFLLDVLWTRCVIGVQCRRATTAATLSVLLYACTIVSTVLVIDGNIPAIVTYAVGGWLGTYVAVRMSK